MTSTSRSPARAHPEAILTVIGAGAIVSVWLWWHGTPRIHGTGDWLTSAGRILGLLAGYAVVVLIALMARIPPLERGIGADRLARWHAMGGRYTVGLVVAHALLITWGYAVTTHDSVTGQAATLLGSYPDVLAATIGGLLLVGVGIVSARAARRRLRYETWYYLHLCTYLAVALGFSHQLSDGAQFIASTLARIAWTGMYAAVAAAIAWFRFVTPARQAFRHRLRVAAIRWEAPGVISVLITGQHLDELRAEPGQFFRWRFLARGLWWASSPYSLSAPPRDDVLRITVKAAGDHSRALFGLRKGTRVVSEGPYGAMTPAAQRSRKVLLIAGGAGITPMRAQPRRARRLRMRAARNGAGRHPRAAPRRRSARAHPPRVLRALRGHHPDAPRHPRDRQHGGLPGPAAVLQGPQHLFRRAAPCPCHRPRHHGHPVVLPQPGHQQGPSEDGQSRPHWPRRAGDSGRERRADHLRPGPGHHQGH